MKPVKSPSSDPSLMVVCPVCNAPKGMGCQNIMRPDLRVNPPHVGRREAYAFWKLSLGNHGFVQQTTGDEVI